MVCDLLPSRRLGFGPLTTALVVGGLALAAAMLSGCERPQEAAAVKKDIAVPVTVAMVRNTVMPIQVRAVGNVEPYSTVDLKSQVSGPIVAIHFQEGQDVKKGDLLFSIDPRPYEIALALAQARLAQDTASASDAESQARQEFDLLQHHVATQREYDHSRAVADALAATVQADRTAIDNAKLMIEYCSIRAPIDGRTGSAQLHVGDITKANDVPVLITLNQVQPIYVDFSVPERELARIKKYQAQALLEIAVQIPGDSASTIRGPVTFLDNQVDTTTGMIRLKATFHNADRRLWPGQFVDVVLTLGANPNVTVVPAQAVQTGQQGSYVFVVGADKKVGQRPVETGDSVNGLTTMKTGVSAGEVVVTDGQLRLLPGSTVEITNPADIKQPAATQGESEKPQAVEPRP